MAPEAVSASRSIYRGPWRIDITTRPGVPRLVALVALARAIASALEAARAPRPASIGLILTDDAELSSLNATHMGKAGPTDVLSFPLLQPDAFPLHLAVPPPPHGRSGGGVAFALPPGRRLHLGDVVVSVERAMEQAAAGRGGQTGDVHWSSADELLLLVTHGTLHVCGWDHAEPADESAMRALEKRLLAR
jgi:probable rRNA maturation factor